METTTRAGLGSRLLQLCDAALPGIPGSVGIQPERTVVDELGRINRVMIVDDDRASLERIGGMLKAEGFDVLPFTDGELALEQGEIQDVGVVILDVEVGGESGSSLVERLQERSPATRVIFHTANPTLGSAKRAVNLGAFAYHEKESDTSELVRSVHRAFRAQFSHYARGLEELVDVRTRSLAESEERFRDLVETTSDWIWETDALGRYTYCGPQVRSLLGYSPDELLGRFILDIVRPSERRSVDRAASIVRRTKPRFRSAEIPILCRDGSTVIHEFRWVPVHGADGAVKGYRGMGRDVTESRRLEEQLRQSQKLDAVGRLAGGIAHDFNNLLTVVVGNSEILALDPLPRDEVVAFAESTLAAAERGAQLTRQLLSFASRRPMEAEVFDFVATVDRLADLLRRLMGDHIALDLRRPRAPVWMRADPGQIEQVLVNLSINARDAMPSGGRLSIEIEVVPGEAEQAPSGQAVAMPAIDSIEVTVRDDGEGISPEHVDKIFEPFFSTKGPEGGVGLGLASVYGIVRRSEGDISVESEPGVGTTFRLHFPSAEAPSAAEVASPGELAEGPVRETILLVEDEDAVRTLAERILTHRGYTVASYGAPLEALDYADDPANRIDLLLTDVMMPDLIGGELAERVRAARPDLKVLFVSGYNRDLGGGGEPGRNFMLEKPFTVDRLLRAVREAIDA